MATGLAPIAGASSGIGISLARGLAPGAVKAAMDEKMARPDENKVS